MSGSTAGNILGLTAAQAALDQANGALSKQLINNGGLLEGIASDATATALGAVIAYYDLIGTNGALHNFGADILDGASFAKTSADGERILSDFATLGSAAGKVLVAAAALPEESAAATAVGLVGLAGAGLGLTSAFTNYVSQLPTQYTAPTDLSGYQDYSSMYPSGTIPFSTGEIGTGTSSSIPGSTTSSDNIDSGEVSAPPVSSYLPDGIITPPDQSTPIPDTTVTGDVGSIPDTTIGDTTGSAPNTTIGDTTGSAPNTTLEGTDTSNITSADTSARVSDDNAGTGGGTSNPSDVLIPVTSNTTDPNNPYSLYVAPTTTVDATAAPPVDTASTTPGPTTTTVPATTTTSDFAPLSSDMYLAPLDGSTTPLTSSEGNLFYTAPGGSDAAFVAALTASPAPTVTTGPGEVTTIPVLPAGSEVSISDFGSNPNNVADLGAQFSNPTAAFAALQSDGQGGSILPFSNGSSVHFIGDNTLSAANFTVS